MPQQQLSKEEIIRTEDNVVEMATGRTPFWCATMLRYLRALGWNDEKAHKERVKAGASD